ncbi:unnamed protein product [Sphagnum jensenii]|uniref:Glycosyl hydrolase family 95 N-terminal domain-containing protein n=1 Tax=Sphagnum jensenii TaxID=128206 RepID=A0ABP1AWW6_9BRYO
MEGVGRFPEDEEPVVRFFEPAQHWPEALPVGSGRLGAMVFGGVESELVQLNEDTLWSGGPSDWNNPRARELLPQVRELVWAGKFAEATALSRQMVGPDTQVYQPLGDLKLDFGEAHRAYDTASYERQLDLSTATTILNYTIDDTAYLRQTFASYPHQIIAMRVAASKEASISFSAKLDSQLLQEARTVGHHQIVLTGQCPGGRNGGRVLEGTTTTTVTTGGSDDNGSGLLQTTGAKGMLFAAILEVKVVGASVKVEATDDHTISVRDADWAELYIAASSSFRGPFKDASSAQEEEPIDLASATLRKIQGLSFDELFAAHLADYQPLFYRVSLRIGNNRDTVSETDAVVHFQGQLKLDPKKKRHSTRDRVLMFADNEDPALVVLLFQFGRYLLIASSRPGTFVSNLQGVWNNQLYPAWRCCPTLNINLEMNYWHAETCNLPECHQPLFDLIADLSVTGATTAKVNYGLGGWVSHHNADIWAQTAPVAGDPVWALWPMSGAWLCLHLWEHYMFSLDKEFLRNQAFPLLKGCADFFLDWLVEDGNGNLVTNPSTSPEHHFIAPDGREASVSYGSTMDMAILHDLFSAIISAATVLGGIEKELVNKLQSAIDRLLPPKIGSDGCLMEWVKEFKDPEIKHRHMSHLFGVYPGHSLTPQTTPELCKAAANSMIKRGEIGPGWSMAWKTALWARLWNSAHAYSMVKRMFHLIEASETHELFDGGGVYANLFNAHPPFQIDGNFGFTAAIAEMLFQSDEHNLYVLPALPARQWRDGFVTGLRGRGAITVGIRWIGGNLEEVDIQVEKGFLDSRKLHYKDKVVELPKTTAGPMYYEFDGDLNLRKTTVLGNPIAGNNSHRCVVL